MESKSHAELVDLCRAQVRTIEDMTVRLQGEMQLNDEHLEHVARLSKELAEAKAGAVQQHAQAHKPQDQAIRSIDLGYRYTHVCIAGKWYPFEDIVTALAIADRQQHAQAAQQFDFAKLLMYPQEWDVAAYPTIESAMWEAISCAQIMSAIAHERNAAKQIAAPAQPVAGELPALPDTHYNGCGDGSEPLYTPEMMHDYAVAYGHQCRAAALEEAIKACSEQTNYLLHERGAFIAAIRALNKTEK